MRIRAIAVLLAALSIVTATITNAATVGVPAGPSAGLKVAVDLTLPHSPGVLLVGFVRGTSANDRAATRASVQVASASPISSLATDAEKWRLPAGADLQRAIGDLSGNPNVRYAEPDWLVRSLDTSNDPYYTNGSLWGMHGDGITPNANQFGTGADEAWAMGATGSNSVYVGIIDEGAQFSHPDLAANYWTNPYENATDGIDNDGNGYRDDVHGWDFFNNDASTYDAGGDTHGTHVSGTIGGVGGNGIGVAGVNWRVTLINGKFLGSGGGSTAGATAAVDYMTDLKTRHGLNIVATSNSWGGGGFSQTLLDAINRGGNAGILFIAAAGNSASNNDLGGYYPSGYQCTNGGSRAWDCVMSVAAIDSAGNLASFSSYGATTVDLGAPGVSVNSTLPTDTYGSYSGTSMATPHVSGAAALCASMAPGLTAREIRNALTGTTRSTASLAGKTVSGGRLDVGTLIASGACGYAAVPPTGAVSNLAAVATGLSTVSLTWTDTISDESTYEIEKAPGTAPTCGTFASAGATGPNATSYVVGGLSAGTAYCFRVRGANSYSEGTNKTEWSNVAGATTFAPPPPYACSTVGYSWVDPTGGTTYALGDDGSVYVGLPFSVTSYGSSFSGVTIGSNGFVRLGSGSATSYSNVPIPNTTDPNAFYAPAWDDWNPGAGGSVSAKIVGTAPSRRLVVTWAGVPHFSVAGSAVSFQAILEEGGDGVTFQYLDMLTGNATYDRGANATAGVEGATGEWGTQISSNTASLTDGLAKRCSAVAGVPPVLSVLASYPDATTGDVYASAGASASGGVGPYAWTLASGSLPTGLALDPSTGVISGTPTATGTVTFTLRATGADGGTQVSASRSIRTAAPLAISTSSLAIATTDTPYSAQLATSGGTSPVTWALADGSKLPDGLTLSTSGLVSGTALSDGTVGVTFVATDAAQPVGRVATRTLSLTVVMPLVLSSSPFPDATTGVAYEHALNVTNAVGPVTWSVTGSLPAGLVIDPSTGVISGTPTTAGTSTFTVTAAGTGTAGSRSGTIRVSAPLGIVQAGALAGGTPDVAYSSTLTTTGGLGPVTWSMTGALTDGLTLDPSTGVISGRPAQAGAFTIVVTATDAAWPVARTDTHTLTLAIAFTRRAPANNFRYPKGTTSALLSWWPYAGASSYDVCVTTSSKGCGTSGWVMNVTSPSFPKPGVSGGQTWYWTVRAVMPGATVAVSGGYWKFTIAK